ncbi:MAG: hypothetical protein QNK23_00245 [Crocinitomicaceae bacterium]|nr:hypothetical protein [Crocinitomicaceae bacterium]
MKLLLSICVLCISFLADSQGLSNTIDKKDKILFIEGNLGARAGQMDTSPGYAMNSSGFYVSGGIGFMFNRIIGIRGTFGYDGIYAFNATTLKKAQTDLFSISIGGIVSISEWAKFSTRRFNLNFHFGVGWTTMSNKKFKLDNPAYDDGMLMKRNDDVGHIKFGLTPYIHVNDVISFTSDLSFLMLTSYHFNVDYQSMRSVRGWDNYFNLSVGILFRLKTFSDRTENKPSN